MIIFDPNLFAYFALLAWIVVAFVAFARLPPAVACFVALIGADLLLPVGAAFSGRGLPDMGRGRIAALAALAACVTFHPQRLRQAAKNPWFLAFLAALLGGSVATAMTNGDVAIQGIVGIPALSPKDGVSLAFTQSLDYAVPFFLGLALFRTEQDLVRLQRLMVITALAYSLLILFELRMSPQLHNWVYGYAPHSFAQHMRGSGYRPIVFLGHGLAVSMFVSTSVLCAVGLWRARLPVFGNIPAWLAAGYLMVLLILCKSFAAVVYAALGSLLILATGVRVRLLAASVLVAIVILFPLLRTVDMVPVDWMVETAETLSAERAGSLKFRFDNEALLLERAQDRIWLGWGTWGRNRVFDPDWGNDLTTVDGLWILELGTFGLFGFLTRFSLTVVPVWMGLRAIGRIRSRRVQALFSSVALIVAFRAVDLLPNSGLGAITLVFSGALAGLSIGLPVQERGRRRAARRARAAEAAIPARSPSPDTASVRV